MVDTENFESEAQSEFNKFKSYSEEDKSKVFENEEKIKKLSQNNTLSKFAEDISLYFKMLKDFFAKKYTKIPTSIIAAIIGTLLYVLSPVDLIPDVIPVVGFLDDASILAMCLKLCGENLKKYKEWLKSQDN